MTTINCPAGFFQDDAVTPATITDLLSAVNAASTNISGAATSATAAAASATAAANSATAAAGSANSASSSVTAAASSATAAAGSASTATTQATNAASSATAASTSASNAATSASNAATSASNASGSVTAAANSASAAATSATNAANSASAAAASQASVAAAVGTIPTPGVGNKLAMIRINAAGNAYESQTPAQVATNIGALNDVGRNFLHNAKFEIAQRGTGPFTTLNTYTVDRWIIVGGLDTVSVSPVALTDADRAAIGTEEGTIALQNVFTGNATSTAFSALTQRIENVRRLSNKTVTVSFWAKANAGTPKVGVSCDQVFGTGGSPSASISGTGTAVTLSTSWQRFSVQVSIPSISGKTLGTNGDHFTEVNLWFSSGSANNALSGGIGVQSGTIKLWGVQLEVGSVMTQFERVDPQTDLANCQRFFQVGQVAYAASTAASGSVVQSFNFQVSMRALPTVVYTPASAVNVTGAGVNAISAQSGEYAANGGAAGGFAMAGSYTLSADL